jgi:mannose-6-phosphate isomerase
MPELLQVVPEYHHRVWGGQRLKPNLEKPYGEAWLVFERNKIKSGSFAGKTLEEVARVLGAQLLGARAIERTGTRFPLLIKILDCAAWLSVQVHPNDEQALKLEGKGQFGKTEAWHVLAAQPGAELIAGVKPGTSASQLEQAIRHGSSVLGVSQKHVVETGATVMMPAGTLHALGPGLLIYEVQQTSDTTYRVFDWDRPASAGRLLHIYQSIAVTNPNSSGEINHKIMQNAGVQTRVECEYFKLEQIVETAATIVCNTKNSSFHAITVTQGQAEVVLGESRVTLSKFETVIVPANAGEYKIVPLEPFSALRSSVPEV